MQIWCVLMSIFMFRVGLGKGEGGGGGARSPFNPDFGYVPDLILVSSHTSFRLLFAYILPPPPCPPSPAVCLSICSSPSTQSSQDSFKTVYSWFPHGNEPDFLPLQSAHLLAEILVRDLSFCRYRLGPPPVAH